MDAARVAAGDSLHEATDGDAVDLQCEVNRVRHPAVRMQARTGATKRCCEQTFEELVVLLSGEDRARRAAPLDHVVRSSRNVQSLTTRHAATSVCKLETGHRGPRVRRALYGGAPTYPAIFFLGRCRGTRSRF